MSDAASPSLPARGKRIEHLLVLRLVVLQRIAALMARVQAGAKARLALGRPESLRQTQLAL